jgi:hypothetical protein
MMPKILINLYDERNMYKLVTDITTRVASSAEIRENLFLYDYYDIRDGETPEIIADKMYNDSHLHWVILLCNDIIDPVYDWVLPYNILLQHVIDTYGEDNINKTHHYENENGDWVNSDYPNCYHVTNIEYAEQENEKKRQIKLLQPRYIAAFVDEVESKMKQQVL